MIRDSIPPPPYEEYTQETKDTTVTLELHHLKKMHTDLPTQDAHSHFNHRKRSKRDSPHSHHKHRRRTRSVRCKRGAPHEPELPDDHQYPDWGMAYNRGDTEEQHQKEYDLPHRYHPRRKHRKKSHYPSDSHGDEDSLDTDLHSLRSINKHKAQARMSTRKRRKDSGISDHSTYDASHYPSALKKSTNTRLRRQHRERKRNKRTRHCEDKEEWSMEYNRKHRREGDPSSDSHTKHGAFDSINKHKAKEMQPQTQSTRMATMNRRKDSSSRLQGVTGINIKAITCDDDNVLCAICRNKLNSACVECQAFQFATSKPDCIIAGSTGCEHMYHSHCIHRWLKNHKISCPLDNKQWAFQMSNSPPDSSADTHLRRKHRRVNHDPSSHPKHRNRRKKRYSKSRSEKAVRNAYRSKSADIDDDIKMLCGALINGFLRSTSTQSYIEIVPLDILHLIAAFVDKKDVEVSVDYKKKLQAKMDNYKRNCKFSNTWRPYLESFISQWIRSYILAVVIPSVFALICVVADIDGYALCDDDSYFINPLLFLIIGAGICITYGLSLLFYIYFIRRAIKQIEHKTAQTAVTAPLGDIIQFFIDTAYKETCLRRLRSLHTILKCIIWSFLLVWCICGFITITLPTHCKQSIILYIAVISWCVIILLFVLYRSIHILWILYHGFLILTQNIYGLSFLVVLVFRSGHIVFDVIPSVLTLMFVLRDDDSTDCDDSWLIDPLLFLIIGVVIFLIYGLLLSFITCHTFATDWRGHVSAYQMHEDYTSDLELSRTLWWVCAALLLLLLIWSVCALMYMGSECTSRRAISWWSMFMIFRFILVGLCKKDDEVDE
eukprot:182019_1